MTTNRKEALPILEKILKDEVKLEDAEENVEILFSVLDVFVEEMKTVNSLFDKLFNRIFFTGSYFDGLRVKNATEFDLNLILVFPFKSTDFEILTNCTPPFAKFHLTANMEELTTRNRWPEIQNTLKFFEGDYLIPEEIRRWFQGIIDATTENLPPIPKVDEILKSSSGPARTLNIITESGVQLDVDLVPVIEFKWPNWPNNAKKRFRNQNIPGEKRYWFLVPKPASPDQVGRKHKRKVHLFWRLHFPGIESHLLHNKGYAKPVIKLMKLLRDKEDWQVLASYCLKTVVMWSIIKDDLDWMGNNMDELFITMLKKLEKYINAHMLPCLSFPSCNLLHKLKTNPGLSDNIYHSLRSRIECIERDPEEYNTLMKDEVPAQS